MRFSQEGCHPKKKLIFKIIYSTPLKVELQTLPPNPVRTMAEWEELQAIVVTWSPGGSNGITNILRDIVRYAKEEVEVIIVCSNAALVKNSLGAVGIDWSHEYYFS